MYMLVQRREMTGRKQTLQWWMGGEGVKTTGNKIPWPRWHTVIYIIFVADTTSFGLDPSRSDFSPVLYVYLVLKLLAAALILFVRYVCVYLPPGKVKQRSSLTPIAIASSLHIIAMANKGHVRCSSPAPSTRSFVWNFLRELLEQTALSYW